MGHESGTSVAIFTTVLAYLALGKVVGLYAAMPMAIESTLNRQLFQEAALVVRVITMAGMVVAGVAQSSYMLTLQSEACTYLPESNPTGLNDRLQYLVAFSKESLLEVR